VFKPEEGHDRAAARCRWSPSFAGNNAGIRAGRPSHTKAVRYSADPPTIEEIVAVMRAAGAARTAAGCAA
jgi:hypothetical protein